MLEWLRARDAGLSALRRAVRTAVIMPALFAFGTQVAHNPTFATFAAFGSFAMLLLADFGGPMRDRLAAQASLVLVGAALVCLGTLASREPWLATAGMVAVGFAVLFSGVVSSVLAAATTSVLLAFILPVTLPGPPGEIPARAGGWLLAGAVSLVAVRVLWPAPVRDPLRDAAAKACRLLSDRLRQPPGQLSAPDDTAPPSAAPPKAAPPSAAPASGQVSALDTAAFGTAASSTAPSTASSTAPASGQVSALDTAVPSTASSTGPGSGQVSVDDEAAAAVAAMRDLFYATPYRPTGLTTAARTVVRLVDEIIWLETILQESPECAEPPVVAVRNAAATLLDHVAKELGPEPDPEDSLEGHLADLIAARDELERAATTSLPVSSIGSVEFVSAMEPSFRAQEMSFAITAIAQNTEATVRAQRRTWWQQVLGRQPDGVGGRFASAQERAGAHAERHSVWLHNSVRGAIGLGGAVLVADLTGVQHSFWVVLGTLAVLRSNALTTGQNVLRALLGTTAGFILGGLLVLAIGTNTTVLWALLPLAIVFAGLAPAVISFAAGQAGFTITLLILFNIISPAGWQVGLVRIEDVAIGCVISLLVGAMFWPRGAVTALALALAEAYTDAAAYLRAAVAAPRTAVAAEQAAAASARRLDDAFRGFLAERGAKHLPLAEVAALATGVIGLRLTAAAIVDLWARDDADPATTGDAQRELASLAAGVAGWYDAMAAALAGGGHVPEALAHDKPADARLIEAVRHGLDSAPAVRAIWTGDHLDAARRLQSTLCAAARAAASYRRSRPAALRRLRPAMENA